MSAEKEPVSVNPEGETFWGGVRAGAHEETVPEDADKLWKDGYAQGHEIKERNQ